MPDERKKLNNLSDKEQYDLRMMRWKARTDLGYLCREILNYPDVSDVIHAPILEILQQFPVPSREQFFLNDKIVNGMWQYTPLQRHTSLPGGRRVLILDPRGWLKTTINAQAHTIQWLLNYPDIAIMIVQSNLEKAEMILGEIKKHFQYNPTFRLLFPEHCPFKSIDDFGTKGKFTTRGRARHITRREESVITSSIDAGTAGIHVDVMKFSDIVEPSNVGTEDQMEGVIESFYMAQNLLVGPNYWIDVEGTRYDFADLYGRIIKNHKDTPEDERTWRIHARGCYKKKEGPETFTSEELLLPDFRNAKGEFIPHWLDPERGFTTAHFEAKRREDPYIFSCQQLNCPQGGIDGRTIFPIIPRQYPTMISRNDFVQNVRVAYYIASVDTAETKNSRSNYTCITIAAFSNDGKVYVNEVIHGKFLPDETANIIQNLTSLDPKKRKGPIYGNKLRAINIEETGFVRGMMVALNNFQHMTGNFLPISLIKRDNQTSKIERIQNSLQPYYMNRRLIFLDDIKCWEQIEAELREFPRSTTDDILDTLADLFQNKEWFGREVPRLNPTQFKSEALAKMLGVENPFSDTGYPDPDPRYASPYMRTGGL